MASSAKPKLFYFDLPGKAELIRLILVYTGTEFEDARFTHEEWGIKYKVEAPLGMAPYLEEGGVKLGGSLAIARYVGEKYGLGGSTPLENAQLGSYADALSDIGTKLHGVKMGPEDKRDECKTEFLKTVPFRLHCLEQHIKGKDSFLVGKVCWVDILLYSIGYFLKWAGFEEVFKDCPKIKAIIDKVSADEKIKAYSAKSIHLPKV